MYNKNIECSLQILNEEKNFTKYYELEEDYIKAHAVSNYGLIVEKDLYALDDFIQEIIIDIWMYSTANRIKAEEYGNTIKKLVANTIKRINES